MHAVTKSKYCSIDVQVQVDGLATRRPCTHICMFSQRGKLSLTNVLNITINLLAGLIRLRQELGCITNPDIPSSTLDHVMFRFRGSFTGMRKGITGNEQYVLNVVHVARWGTRWRSWLRHCTTSRKVAGSIVFDGVIGTFHWKVLRPATSTQVFLGFPVSTSEC